MTVKTSHKVGKRSHDLPSDVSFAVSEAVVAAGAILWSIDKSRVAGRDVISVFVDVKGGINSEQLGAVTREISQTLDGFESSLGSRGYTLEVSSPGVTRQLTAPEHFELCEGRKVHLYLRDGRSLDATIITGGDVVQIQRVDVTEDLKFDDIARAKLVADGI